METVVQRARRGDIEAFETIVYRFQDMAVGYAFSVLGDLHLAEDAAQEAFVQIHRDLNQLREPKAFSSWFRKVIYKQCDRMIRRKRIAAISLDATVAVAVLQPPLSELAEARDMQNLVHEAIWALPEGQRRVVTLFYISEYSQKEIATFLDVPVSTVKKRLYDARQRLKKRMTIMAKDYLQENRPSNGDEFGEKVLTIIAPDRATHGETIYTLFEMEERPDTFQWRAGRLAHSHVDWDTSRIGTVNETGAERVVSAMHVYDMTMRIGCARIRTAGFNCEVTHPAFMDQRMVLIERTVTSSLAAMNSPGYELAISFDDEAFWYKHGFVFGWRALQWHVDVADLPDPSTNLVLHRFEPNHRDDLAHVYNETHQNLTGTVVRPTYLRNKHPEMFMGWYWTDSQGNPAGYISGGADRYVSLDSSLQADLNRAQISESIRRQFAEGSRWDNDPLGADAVCTVQQPGSQWLIEDGERKTFIVREDSQLQGYVFDRPLFWVDELAGDPDSCLQVLGMLTRQWQCEEIFFDRLHYKSGVGKRLRQMISCRIHTGTFGRSHRSYVVRIIDLASLFTKLAPELTKRLAQSPLADWQGNLLISMSEDQSQQEAMLAICDGKVSCVPAVKTPHSIRGGQEVAQLVLGTETADEIVELAGIELSGDAEQLCPVLFPVQYPQMENQAL